MTRFITRSGKRIDESNNPFWISYADLMTALVMLFLVVMSISMVAIANRPIVEKRVRESDIQEILDLLGKKASEKHLDLTINRATHTISFGEKARFGFDSYQLTPDAQDQLRAFVPLLLEVHAQEKGQRWLKRIHIEGYTDESGSYLYNVNLSLNRAQAVVCTLFAADLLPEKQQLLRQLLIIDGASVTGIKENPEDSRRVEVRLEFRQRDELVTLQTPPEMRLGRCAIFLRITKPSRNPTPKKQNQVADPLNPAPASQTPAPTEQTKSNKIPHPDKRLQKPSPQQGNPFSFHDPLEPPREQLLEFPPE